MKKTNQAQTRRDYLSLIYQGKTIEEIAISRGMTYFGVYAYLSGSGLLSLYHKSHPENIKKN